MSIVMDHGIHVKAFPVSAIAMAYSNTPCISTFVATTGLKVENVKLSKRWNIAWKIAYKKYQIIKTSLRVDSCTRYMNHQVNNNEIKN